MPGTQQTYANHTRWHTPFHFILAPILVINFIWAIVEFYRNPGWNHGWWIVVSFALIMLAVLARTNALKAQDRIIRLEERLRYQQVLPAELAQQTGSLTARQIVALRFAADEELAGLVTEVLEGRIGTPTEIKKAIKNWRADTFRV
jgi:hypothetical protein